MGINRRSFISSSYALLGAALASRAQDVPPGDHSPIALLGRREPLKPGERRDARSKRPAVFTEKLASYIAEVRYGDIDTQTLTRTKHRVLDLLGCAIGGVPAPFNAQLVDLVRADGGQAQASVIGYPLKGTVAQVAMLNAVIARSYDFEVMQVVIGDRLVPSHHSPTTCMTSLAIAEQAQLSGREFLTALTVGDDVAARLIGSTGMDWEQGWDGVPVFGSMGATAAACKLRGYTAAKVQDALGIVLDTLAGTLQAVWDGATNWKLVGGMAARNAVFAADLAGRGWVGVQDTLLAPYGLYPQYTGGCKYPETVTAGLGRVFYAEEYFKPYPACAATHGAIECALTLRKRTNLKVEEIERIEVYQPAAILNVFVSKPFEARRDVQCDANFSTQFQVGNALLNGAVLISHYDAAAITNPPLSTLLQKISLHAFADPQQRGVEIRAFLKDGRKLVENHPGDPSHYPNVNGSTYDEIVTKFLYQVRSSGFISEAVANQIVERVGRLEQETNMADIVRMLSPETSKRA
jgi:2-methylcitrate dehydratase